MPITNRAPDVAPQRDIPESRKPVAPRPRRAAGALALLVAAITIAAPSARPALADPVTAGNVTAELISDQETIQPGKPFTVGIALRPSQGWHTYWQNPGDSGLPTRVEWKLPDGFRAGPLEWPHPVRLGTPPFVTYGYEAESLLLTQIDAPATVRAGDDAHLVAVARWLACRDDACIPGKAELALKMRVEDSRPNRDSRWQDAFDAARARVPRRLDGFTAVASESDGKLAIRVAAPDARPSTTGVDVFPLAPRLVDASAQPSVRASDNGYIIEIARDENPSPLPEKLGLVLVADGGWDANGSVRAIEVEATVQAAAVAPAAAASASADPSPQRAADAPATAPTPASSASATAASSASSGARPAATRSAASESAGITLWAAVVLAFAGGLILNLMPCVFPVLSLKILGFVHVAHHDPATVRRHGYAFSFGVLLSFWILAAMLLALRAAGDSLGWGFQLQEPLFVAAMSGLLFLMALNLLGVFEFGASLTTAAGRFDSHSGYRGSFLSGALATVLATPCTAPFMGSALGFALVQPAPVAFAVFTALGAGMASPYIALSCMPKLLARMPRPGSWMQRFREAMAFPLLATVIWLVWVFGRQTGNDGVLLLLLALLAMALGAWALGRSPSRGTARRRIARGVVALSAASAVGLMISASSSAPTGSSAPNAVMAADDGVVWQSWDPAKIDGHRREGRPVLVDFTADWCLSCKVNERVALSGEDFSQQLRGSGAVAMKADWTRSDPRITEALASFGRSGVPLYVVYPKDPAREPIVLPQVLTPGIVREALQKASS